MVNPEPEPDPIMGVSGGNGVVDGCSGCSSKPIIGLGRVGPGIDIESWILGPCCKGHLGAGVVDKVILGPEDACGATELVELGVAPGASGLCLISAPESIATPVEGDVAIGRAGGLCLDQANSDQGSKQHRFDSHHDFEYNMIIY